MRVNNRRKILSSRRVIKTKDSKSYKVGGARAKAKFVKCAIKRMRHRKMCAQHTSAWQLYSVCPNCGCCDQLDWRRNQKTSQWTGNWTDQDSKQRTATTRNRTESRLASLAYRERTADKRRKKMKKDVSESQLLVNPSCVSDD